MKILLALLIFNTLTLGCGKKSKSSKDSPPKENSFDLAGVVNTTFSTGCVVAEDTDHKPFTESIHFSQDSFVMNWVNFNEQNCNEDRKRISYIHKYIDVEKESSAEIEGWDTYSYSVQSITGTVHTASVKKKFNKKKVYGYDDWLVGEAKEITGRRYSSKQKVKPSAGSIRVRTMKTDDDTLYLARYVKNKATVENPWIYKKLK